MCVALRRSVCVRVRVHAHSVYRRLCAQTMRASKRSFVCSFGSNAVDAFVSLKPLCFGQRASFRFGNSALASQSASQPASDTHDRRAHRDSILVARLAKLTLSAHIGCCATQRSASRRSAAAAAATQLVIVIAACVLLCACVAQCSQAPLDRALLAAKLSLLLAQSEHLLSSRGSQ